MSLPPQTQAAPAPDQATREGRAWAGIKGVWRQLHGSFAGQGLSVEWHDFRLEKDMDWGRSFHPGSLEICLNFSGAGALQDGDAEQELAAHQVAVYTLQNRRLRAVRRASSLHRFLTLEIAPGFLRKQFSGEMDSLKAPIREFAELGAQAPPFLEITAMPASLLGARLQFCPAASVRRGTTSVVSRPHARDSFADAVPAGGDGGAVLRATPAGEPAAGGAGAVRDRARLGEPAVAGNAGAGGGVQPVFICRGSLPKNQG